jgi:hypothetical protein
MCVGIYAYNTIFQRGVLVSKAVALQKITNQKKYNGNSMHVTAQN